MLLFIFYFAVYGILGRFSFQFYFYLHGIDSIFYLFVHVHLLFDVYSTNRYTDNWVSDSAKISIKFYSFFVELKR